MKGVRLEFYFLNKVVSPPSFPAVGNLSQMSYIRVRKARHRSRVISFFLFGGCPSLLYVVFGAYPINILSDIIFSCTYSPEVIHTLHNSSCRRYSRNKVAQKNDLILYQVDVQTKHARNEKYFNSTKRNNIKRRIRAIFYWYYNTCSSPADVKQNKRLRVYHSNMQNFSNYLPFGTDANFGNYPDAADVKIQPNS